MDIGDLIQAIIPLYNTYKQSGNSITPTERIMLMWDIGELLKDYVDEHKIKPYSLYRQIYGKSKTSENVKQKSYIAEQFLSRSYRIRCLFKSKNLVTKQLPNLSLIDHFRESMPFFDNPRYKLDQKSLDKLITVLNSSMTNREKENYIKKLQSERIGIKNPRTQLLESMERDKKVFVSFYNDVVDAMKIRDYQIAKTKLSIPSSQFVKTLAMNCGAISADGLKMTQFKLPKNLDRNWESFALLIHHLVSKDRPEERRRFRRLVPPERMLRLAEMLYALSGAKRYREQNFPL